MQEKLITKNKKALFDYEIIKTWEAWIELKWYEVKAIKEGEINLKWSFIISKNAELFLKECHISPLACLPQNSIDPKRERKILLHKKDILYLIWQMKEKWKSVIGLEIYQKWSIIKIKVALVQGKKKYDKKQVLKERTMEKEARIQMKKFNY